MYNHVGLLGRLAQEPELRYTQNGVPVASFDLAVQVPSKDKNTPLLSLLFFGSFLVALRSVRRSSGGRFPVARCYEMLASSAGKSRPSL